MAGDDPLEGAAIGETRHVTEEVEMYPDPPWEWVGNDRQRDVEIAEVEVEEDEYGQHLRVTWEADLTKRLGPYWDDCREPRTADEERHQRRLRWLARAAGFLAVAVPVFLIMILSGFFTSRLTRNMVVNGERVGGTFVDLLPAVFLFGLVLIIISYGLSGGFPGTAGRRYYR